MSSTRLNVLLIEDNPGDVRLIREMLKSQGYMGMIYNLYHVDSLQTAEAKYSGERFNVILLDVNLPDSTGLSTVQRLNAMAPQFPIVILTGMHDEQLALRSVQQSLREPAVLNGQGTSIKASIGISIFPDDADEIETLTRHADAAIYAAKRQHVAVCFYKDEDVC